MKVKIVKLNEDSIIPTRGSELSAGYDLYSVEEYNVPPFENIKVKTGLSIQPPQGYFGAIFARSGLATKKGLRPSNCVGVVDEDYRGEIIVPIHNDFEQYKKIEKGDRVAQLIFLPYLNIEFEEVNELDKTQRNSNGFGSSGK